MANTYFTPDRKNSHFVPVEPTVLSQVVSCAASTAGADYLVPIPWENCKITHIQSTVVSAVDTAADTTITVELDNGKIILADDKAVLTAQPIPPFMRNLIASGGLMNYVKGKAGI